MKNGSRIQPGQVQNMKSHANQQWSLWCTPSQQSLISLGGRTANITSTGQCGHRSIECVTSIRIGDLAGLVQCTGSTHGSTQLFSKQICCGCFSLVGCVFLWGFWRGCIPFRRWHVFPLTLCYFSHCAASVMEGGDGRRVGWPTSWPQGGHCMAGVTQCGRYFFDRPQTHFGQLNRWLYVVILLV